MDKEQTKCLDRFCYLKVKIDEFELEKSMLQEDIMDWKDRPDKDGVDVPPYGKLCYRSRENWTVLKIPALFKKVGKSIFLEICSVTTGKLKKAVGTVGFKKLVSLKIIKQEDDTEFFQLKKAPVINGALKKGKNKGK